MESKFGDYLLSVDHISLSFGGVKALKDISFGIREKEVFAIIGPNGAGKTSMLNVINGFYHPQEGEITYKGVHRKQMKSHDAAVHGIARTFQNVALFKGMSTIDNIMTGRIIHMKRNLFWQAFYLGPARKEEMQIGNTLRTLLIFWKFKPFVVHPLVACHMVCRNVLSWGGHWQWNQIYCCWMNRWRG